jgi:hypothetical protein
VTVSAHRRGKPGPTRLRSFLTAALWLSAGGALMFGLAQLPSYLDTLLFFSTALRNLTLGLMHFGAGLLQLSGALLLLGLVSLSLVLLIGGVIRAVRAFMASPVQTVRRAKPRTKVRRQQPATSYLLQSR